MTTAAFHWRLKQFKIIKKKKQQKYNNKKNSANCCGADSVLLPLPAASTSTAEITDAYQLVSRRQLCKYAQEQNTAGSARTHTRAHTLTHTHTTIHSGSDNRGFVSAAAASQAAESGKASAGSRLSQQLSTSTFREQN